MSLINKTRATTLKSAQQLIRRPKTTVASPFPAPVAPLALSHLTPGDTSRSSLHSHYLTTLSHDLLYLLYSHSPSSSPPPPNPLSRSPIWSPSNPFAVNRAPPRPKGNRYLVPNPSYTSAKGIPVLESIVVSTMDKSVLQNKNNLLPLLMAYKAITGEALQSKHPGAYGPGSGRGLVVTKSAKKSSSFKVRAGAPTGVKVELRGQPMYTFLSTLTSIVLPRLKTFSGVPLPALSHPRQSTSSTSGVVAFGLPSEAMALFPQVEMNLDSYTRLSGFNVFCITSARGRGAQDQARALLGGMGVPFVKR